MKKLFSYITAFTIGIILTVSCSGPTNVAEKALKLAGRGTFVPTTIDKYLGSDNMATIGLFTDHDDIFDSALIHTDEAEFFLKYGYFKETPRRAYFDFSDIMFSKYQLIKQDEVAYDVRNIMDFSKMEGLTDEAIQSLKDAYKHLNEEYQEQGSIATWLEGKGVPAYIMRYNLDNRYIANIIVLKLPKEGYRVCSFVVE